MVRYRRSGRGGAAQPSPSPLAARPGSGRDRLMPLPLLDRRLEPQRIHGFADQRISALDASPALSGPAVIVGALDSAPKAADHARESRQITRLIASRPLASREQHGDWVEIDTEAADHWTQMTDDLRRRLIDDTQASLDVNEFKQATDGA